MQTKRCCTCKETKSVSEFHKNRRVRDGLAPYCKGCKSKKARKYREANKEKEAERNRRWREANKERVYASRRRYYEDNKEEITEKVRKWREDNKEWATERDRRYREANKKQYQRAVAKYTKEVNSRSLELAHRHGQPWEDWEGEFILADNGLTCYQKAIKLGRSYSSVNGRISKLRKSARAELTNGIVRV